MGPAPRTEVLTLEPLSTPDTRRLIELVGAALEDRVLPPESGRID